VCESLNELQLESLQILHISFDIGTLYTLSFNFIFDFVK